MRRIDDLSKELREIEACEKANEPKKKLTFMKRLVLNIILLAFAVGVLAAYAVNSVRKLIRMVRTVGGYDAHDKAVFAAFGEESARFLPKTNTQIWRSITMQTAIWSTFSDV